MTQPDEAAEGRRYVLSQVQLDNIIVAAQARSRQEVIEQIREATPSRRRMMTGAGDVTARINEARKNQNEIIDALDAVLRKLSKETTE